MVKIYIKNLDEFISFPRTFAIDVTSSDANPLCYQEKSRTKTQYAEFYLADILGEFVFPSAVIWELDTKPSTAFILALGFDPITEVRGRKLDKNEKKEHLRIKGDLDIEFFKVRCASVRDVKSNDTELQKVLDSVNKSWERQLNTTKANYDRMEAGLKQQMTSMEEENTKFMENQIMDAQRWKGTILQRMNQAAMAGTRPLGIKAKEAGEHE